MATFRDTILADAPSAYWRLGDPGGQNLSVCADETVNERGLTLVGVALGEPGLVEGTSAGFFGSAYATTTVPLSTSAQSFELVMAPHALLMGYLLSTPDFALLMRGTSLRIWAFGQEVVTGPTLPLLSGLGKYHVVLSWEAGRLRLMVNGDLSVDQAGFPGPAVPSPRVTLGARLGAVMDHGYAVLGEVAVYPTALSPAQAAAHFAEINASPNTWPSLPSMDPEQEPSMFVNRTQMATAAADIKAKAEALDAALQAYCALSPSLTDYEGGIALRSTCTSSHSTITEIAAAADATALWLAANPPED